MKKTKSILFGFLALCLMSACSDDDNNSVNNNTNTSEVIQTVQSGNWRVTSFVEDGNDETNHYTGFTFTFGANNVLTAQNGDTVHTGTWSVTQDNSDDDDSPGSDIDFNIGFSAPPQFEELSDDWDILERTATKIRLVDVSGGNGGTDYLNFEKN